MSLAFNNVLGRAETEFNPNPTQTQLKKELDKEAFLKLLVTQLGHQDPLNPMEDKEFTAQLADFSSLEQLTGINKGIENLNMGAQRQEMLTAVSFIGKEVLASGKEVSKIDDYVSTVYYKIEEPVSSMQINVFDQWGNIVRTVKAGSMQAGTYKFTWDGKDYNGNTVSNGIYSLAMAGLDKDDKTVLIDTEVAGIVSGVQTDNGKHLLRLSDNRLVDFLNIKEVVNSAKDTPDKGDNTDDSGETAGNS